MSTVDDAKVLNAILNPNTPFEGEDIPKKDESTYEKSASITEAKEHEVAGVKAAEANDLKASIDCFNKAIEVAPHWASAYNNRAQCLRLTGDVDAVDADTLADQHRKQKKELTAKVQSLKKTVNKGDKKKKKLIDAEIEKLEKDFADKCALEISNLSAQKPAELIVDELNKLDELKPKMSKAQKKREKKEADEKQREKDIALQEIENLKGPAHIELTKIKEKLLKMNLEMKEVCADGNCMFYAISDQLNQHLNIQKPFKELRELTSNHMLQNPDSFQPFLCSEETGDPLTETEYKVYCEKITECVAPVWGSMTELKALSEILSVPIQVVQAEGAETLIENSNDNKKLVITYHRRMFGSGEHYNSTCSKKKDNDF